MADIDLDDWIRLSRTVTDDDRTRVEPPPGLFDSIAAAVANDPVAEPAPETTRLEPPPIPEPEPATVVDFDAARSRRAPRARRRNRRRLALGGVAAALAAVIGLSIIDTDDAVTTFVAEATNAELTEPYDGTATATISGESDQTLDLDFSAPLPDGEPIEVWLIKPDLSDMVSLGLLDDATSEFSVPSDIDVREFSIVDLSIEPNDGDPTHSGRSILRGALRSI